MRDRISKKERNLMIHSQVTEEYPWLNALLHKQVKVELEEVPQEHHSDFLYVIPYILKQCGEEWKGNETVLHPVEDLGDHRRPCGLCGTPNRYIYYIQNRLNGKTLNVGGDCVEEFVDIDFLREGKTKGQLLREAKQIFRRSIINKEFPNIENKIAEWNGTIERFEVLIPNYLSSPYISLGMKLQDMFQDFLEEKIDEASFDDFKQNLLIERELFTQLEEYQKCNKDDSFIATNRLVRWLASRKEYQTIEFLREDGRITPRSITRVWERSFVDKNISEIMQKFATVGVTVENLDYEVSGFVLSSPASKIKLVCPFEKFFIHFGATLFGEHTSAKLDLRNVIRISEFYGEGSYYAAIDIIKSAMRKWQFYISTDTDFLTTSSILLVDRANNTVLPYNLNDFLRQFKGLALNLQKPTREDFEDFCKSVPGRWMKRSEWTDARTVAGEMHRVPGR